MSSYRQAGRSNVSAARRGRSPRVWARRLDAAEKSQSRTSETTGGWWKRCRQRGRRSRRRLSRKAIRQRESFASTICARRSTQQCAVAGTRHHRRHRGRTARRCILGICVPADRRRTLHGWPGMRTRDSSNWLLRSPAEALPWLRLQLQRLRTGCSRRESLRRPCLARPHRHCGRCPRC
jgi:hypothetical protein